ncbi:MAG TPA: methyltransferase domain-containing protein [Pseudomonadales bacterium]
MIAWRSLLLVVLHALAAPIAAGAPGAPYVPTPDDIVERMLALAEVGEHDHLIDLGSGDGRIVLAAAERGASGLGVEIRQDLVDRARRAAEARGVSDRVRFVREDLFTTDLSGATVVTLYLMPEMLERLRAKLLWELEPGTRVLSHDYPIPNWRSERAVEFDHPAKVDVTGVTRTVLYLYRVPAEVHGHWVARVDTDSDGSEPVAGEPLKLEFAQRVTDVLGRMHRDGGPVPLEDVTLAGRTLRFTLPERKLRFVGQVDGRTIEGTLAGEGVSGRWRAHRS